MAAMRDNPTVGEEDRKRITDVIEKISKKREKKNAKAEKIKKRLNEIKAEICNQEIIAKNATKIKKKLLQSAIGDEEMHEIKEFFFHNASSLNIPLEEIMICWDEEDGRWKVRGRLKSMLYMDIDEAEEKWERLVRRFKARKIYDKYYTYY